MPGTRVRPEAGPSTCLAPGIHALFPGKNTWVAGTQACESTPSFERQCRAMTTRGFRDEELLADVIARLIGDVRHVAVGNASPIPATAALLARARGRGRPYVSLLQSRKHNFFTDGARELFDCAGQGRID